MADDHPLVTDESSARWPGADALGPSERRFRRLIEGAADVFFVIDRSGAVVYRSEGGKRLTGWDDEEVRGRPLTTFVLPESQAAAREAIAATLSHPGEVARAELRVRRKDGSVVDIEAQGRNLLDDPDVRGIVITAHDITASKRTEQALRASQQVLEAILDAMPVRVFWKDRDLVYRGCNATFAHDAGFADASAVIGRDDYQMAWRDQAERYRNDDREVIESGRPRLLIEEPQTTPDGTEIALLTSKLPLRGTAGEISGVLGTYLDVTERKLAQESLKASEMRYRRLFEAAKDGILILDAGTGRVVDVNPFLIELLGFSREHFLERRVWELGFFGDRLANEANFVELRERGYIRYDDMALRARDGRRIEVEFISNLYEVNQAPVIQCNIRDISDRKRAEEATRRLATAVEQSAEAVLITDVEGAILYTNPAFESVSGYSREEAVGRNPSLLKSGRQDDAFYRRMWETLSAGEVWRGRLVNRRKDGTLFEEEATISPVRDSAGRVVNYVAAKRDVTNESRLEKQLIEAQKMESIGRLAGGVAHDFNNLLGVILGCGEILQGELSEGDPRREGVGEMLKAAEQAAGLTRQLLAFSRRQVQNFEVLDLRAIVANLGKMLQRLVGEDLELATRIAPDTGRVRADRGQIEQVLLNLVVNARDALSPGGRITLETRNVELDANAVVDHPDTQPGAYVLLEVHDTGAGMDAETQAQVFEPFFTTKETGKGTGLGLATVHGIVHQSGGSVWVQSEVGVGTTFGILLPRVEEALQAAGEVRSVPLPRGVETVLLVEDEPALRTLLRRVLESHGYTVLAAADGEEALRVAAAQAEPIQILVTDVIMPGLSGIELAELVRRAQPATKVLYLSGYSDESVTRSVLVGPGSAFLDKPFGLGALLRTVRELLDAR